MARAKRAARLAVGVLALSSVWSGIGWAQEQSQLEEAVVAPLPADIDSLPPIDAPVLQDDRTQAAFDVSNEGDLRGVDLGSLGIDENSLSLADVVASVYRFYPEIERARTERSRTQGESVSAWGAYDTKLGAFSLNEPMGYYKNYRHGIGLARQTWWGGYLSAGYRLGRGSVQPWYKERQTDEGGEFKLAMVQPLLQGRAIDAQRVAIFQAALGQQAAEPAIQQAILETSRDAVTIYWQWVASGAVLAAQRELLDLAEARRNQIEGGVRAGKFAEIDLLLNQQLIAERRVKLVETEQKFRATSFKLSLYLRDGSGEPLVPSDLWLPRKFPEVQPPRRAPFDTDLAAALTRRPEPRLLQLEIQKVQLDRQLACNQTLPTLDFVAEASQDIGEPATKSDDKGDFELLVGLQSEVPIQRRKARGKIQSSTAKIAQISQKRRLTQDKIATELHTSRNALHLNTQVVRQSEQAYRAALETLNRYRFAFDRGKVDLIYLNLVESKANETEIKYIESQRAWYASLADLQYALGLDPMDQAMKVADGSDGRESDESDGTDP
ncbi:MAG: TolC family protein [Planctomycetales bacterium]|nr:TolC family protein [Planctomycetales bacterium]